MRLSSLWTCASRRVRAEAPSDADTLYSMIAAQFSRAFFADSDNEAFMDINQATKGCPIFKLPGELRNKIYRYALVAEDSDYTVMQCRSQLVPGLLNTCKAIRHECHAIYFMENSFVLLLRSYDCVLVEKWVKAIAPYKSSLKELPKTKIVLDMHRHWGKFATWLKRVRPTVRESIGLVVQDWPQTPLFPGSTITYDQVLMVETFKLSYQASTWKARRYLQQSCVMQHNDGILYLDWVIHG
ncbi:hypothetical protein LTR95_016572 [Oleoguttula sp. CCFEE 5521]